MSIDHKPFEKTSLNGKITLIVSEKHFPQDEPVDGVIVVDEDYIQGSRKISAEFSGKICILGLNVIENPYKTTIFTSTKQLWPQSEISNLTEFQNAMMQKLGPMAIPFTFHFPPESPSSIMLYDPTYNQHNGISYSIKIHCGRIECDSIEEESIVCMEVGIINVKLEEGSQPCDTVCKSFSSIFRREQIKLEATLNKEIFYHGEEISVNVVLSNSSGKTVKKIKARIQQELFIPLASLSQCRCGIIDQVKTKNHRLNAGMVLSLKLALGAQECLAVNGPLEDDGAMKLAATTSYCRDFCRIEVSYCVVVKIYFGGWNGGKLTAKLPFIVGKS